MATPRNKKLLCFIDEYIPGNTSDLYLGAVFVPAAEAGRVDKTFSDLLPANANEVHGVNLEDATIEGLLDGLFKASPSSHLLMINRRITGTTGAAPHVYGNAVVELVKIGMRTFRTEKLTFKLKNERRVLNNLDLILDRNQHNTHPQFEAVMQKSRSEGSFRGVDGVSCIDSAASRLLQIADLVATTRRWIVGGAVRADALRDRFGIRVC
ncbi:DUF3800 domain-containing protein [Azospirillum sp. sgz302134]